MKSSEIRQKFLDFFASKGHQIVGSSSLIPANDPTLLFCNAGMNQFKDVFLGYDKRPYTRATTSQKCVRAGGKHNDLENVGYTARHHTFFEMLGNFSFGDYFKRDAIHYAWEFLTSPAWLGISKEKLMVTVYASDDEAFDIWNKEIGVPAEKIVRIGDNKGAPYASDNFWQMGDTGPCGPCTEIFYDHGAHIWGGPPGSPEEDGDRFIEIWNNVFMQFNRDETGTLNPLPKPSVDTGMGLERISAVMQGVHANYEIDLFQHLIAAAQKATGTADADSPSLRVIADHIRSCAFLIADGALPANDGRGYVLRRIIRRAIRHGYKLGQKGTFFHTLVAPLAEVMGDAYPELRQRQAHIEDALKLEEELFGKTVTIGMGLLEDNLEPVILASKKLIKEAWSDVMFLGCSIKLGYAGLSVYEASVRTRDGRSQRVAIFDIPSNSLYQSDFDEEVKKRGADINYFVSGSLISGDNPQIVDVANEPLDGATAFKLADTYGFPIDLTADVCRERNRTIDMAGFEAALATQRQQSKAAGNFKMSAGLAYDGDASCFHGYSETSYDAKVLGLFKGNQPVTELHAGDEGVVVLDHTPFYAESGGQAGDVGEISVAGGVGALFDVTDTQKVKADVFGHQGALSRGSLKVGDSVVATIDLHKRLATQRNHSATHLLHAALRDVLGKHVEQKGSLVNAERTRFDFSHPKPVTAEELATIEAMVNRVVAANHDVSANLMSYDDAIKSGAMALFGEKYGDEVRVLKMGEFSTELCGGTHVGHTGDIGFFKIVAEGGVAAGVRRVEAVTGEGAVAWVQAAERELKTAQAIVKAQPGELINKLEGLQDNVKALEKELAKLKGQLAGSQSDDLLNQAVNVAGGKLLVATIDGADTAALRDLTDKLKDKLGSAIVVLAGVADGKVALVVGVSKDLSTKVKAGELVNVVAQQVGGKGGGRPDMAMAGGTDVAALPAAMAGVQAWVTARL